MGGEAVRPRGGSEPGSEQFSGAYLSLKPAAGAAGQAAIPDPGGIEESLEPKSNPVQQHAPGSAAAIPTTPATAEEVKNLQADMKAMDAKFADLMKKYEEATSKNKTLEAKLTAMSEAFQKAFPHDDVLEKMFGKNIPSSARNMFSAENLSGKGLNSMCSKWSAGMFGLGLLSVLCPFGLGAVLMWG